MNKSFLNSLPRHLQDHYQEHSEMASKTTLIAFDGSSTIKLAGHIILPVHIGNSSPTDIVFLVSDRAAHPVLLGTPALRTLRLVIDIDDNCVHSKLCSQSFPLVGHPGLHQSAGRAPRQHVALIASDITIPPWSEAVVDANICDFDQCDVSVDVIIQEHPTSAKKHLVAAYGVNSVTSP
jgi:hypothetical protein